MQPQPRRAEVIVYASRSCIWCHMAESLLQAKGVEYVREEVDGPAARRVIYELTGRKTVPQILINGRPIGGYTDLAALESSGRLDALLGA